VTGAESETNMANENETDWSKLDAEHVLSVAPLKLTRQHIAALELKFGVDAAHARIQANCSHALRNVRIEAPYRGPRR
jgi:hypothetical protein